MQFTWNYNKLNTSSYLLYILGFLNDENVVGNLATIRLRLPNGNPEFHLRYKIIKPN